MRSRTALIAMAALLSAGRCLADAIGAGVAPSLTPITAAVDGINSAIRGNQDDAVIRQKADMFAEGMPSTQIDIHVPLHPWRVETDLKDTPADTRRMLGSLSDKFALDTGRVPPPTLLPMMRKIQQMNDAGLINEEKLPDNVMGVNHTREVNGRRFDWVGFNQMLPYIAMKIGDTMAAVVLCHEAGGHAMDPDIMSSGVIDKETFAFKREYDCIKQAYPTGEELGTTRLRLRGELLRHDDFLTRMASKYMDSLDALYGTGGDENKIRKYVEPLYGDGEPVKPSA